MSVQAAKKISGNTSTRSSIDTLLKNVDAFLFDCDGVIWKGNDLIPGAISSIEWLEKQNKKIYFVTNNSAKSRSGYLKKFTELGMNVKSNQIFSTAYDFQKTGKSVYVISHGDGIGEELDLVNISHHGGVKDANKTIDINNVVRVNHDENVGAVIVGTDMNFNYYKLQYAQLCVNNNPDCMFIATNRDAASHASSDDQLYAAAGAMVGAVAGCTTDTKPNGPDIMCGKPSKFLVDLILRDSGLDDRSRICMVGDRLDTDIAFGNTHGLSSLLVYSGVTTPEMAECAMNGDDNIRKPQYVLQSIQDLISNME